MGPVIRDTIATSHVQLMSMAAWMGIQVEISMAGLQRLSCDPNHEMSHELLPIYENAKSPDQPVINP